ncbi:MAG TPA: CHAP domain-containing protein [Pedobacter sp.]|uniref:CHAP domain-containing protein n=1 Tax=Pedobacter sp. TaxID=1411316 RepID=UPI002B816014|nr:CHAP domain-containing protein [Pedobacter sp.]HMI03128.1 CHAP domain-containing protein [Pedobacter sp.]
MFCSGVVGFNSESGVLKQVQNDDRNNKKNYERVIEIARKEIGVREEGGENCGVAVKGYLSYVGIKSPAPWCAAFVSWCFGQAGFVQPRTAWCPALFPDARSGKAPQGRLRKDPLPGRIMGIYFPSKGRIAHCGIVEKVRGDFVYVIEGNTNVAGGRDGDRVMRRLRHNRTIARYADWLN